MHLPPGDTPTEVNEYRRAMLYGGIVGLAGLGGCIGDDDTPDADLEEADIDDVDIADGDDATPEADVVDQTFVMPTSENPEEGSIMFPWMQMPTEFETPYSNAFEVYWMINEPKVWGVHAWVFPGGVHYGLLDDIEIHDSKLVFHINEDAYWSDGQPVRAKDGPPGQFFGYRFAYLDDEGTYVYDDRDPHLHVTKVWDDYNFPDGPDGKVWELTTTHDGLIGEYMADSSARGGLYMRIANSMACNMPTHISPYDDLADALFEEVERGLAGEPVRDSSEIGVEHIDESTFEKFRDPDNVVSSGVWQLDEIRGAEEWVLTPNEHHRYSDELNFNEIRMPWIEEDHRYQAELQAGRLDYGQVDVPPEFVDDITDQGYTQYKAPFAEGGAIAFNHADPVFGKQKVRQAIGYWIDQYEIAETVHPDATIPHEYPGGDMVGRPAIVSDDWVEENLISYQPDRDKAEGLMQEAGFERGNGDTWLHEGEPIEFQYPTPDDTPIEERIVVDQLQDFGFEVHLQSFEEDIFWERYETGEFRMNPVGFFSVGDFVWELQNRYLRVWSWAGRARAYELFKPESINQEAADLEDDGLNALTILRDHLDPYIEVPPIGEPDGELERDHIADRMRTDVYEREIATGSDEWFEHIKGLIWVTNWLLPEYPLYEGVNQHFLNMEKWNWPTDHPTWDIWGESEDIQPHWYLAQNMIQAEPDGSE